ncbi:hypothetical protein AVEN_26335-1 [Araneus ventricosus]|uniref:Uncharacterized protein n=1 Tax=Araneus ventricosus TaxID=182803 RepID=A0A4Y2AN45_ARAVE|nr:hypothetical protein AVEN_26335-1 [Araneus ventricosus]
MTHCLTPLSGVKSSKGGSLGICCRTIPWCRNWESACGNWRIPPMGIYEDAQPRTLSLLLFFQVVYTRLLQMLMFLLLHPVVHGLTRTDIIVMIHHFKFALCVK